MGPGSLGPGGPPGWGAPGPPGPGHFGGFCDIISTCLNSKEDTILIWI
ncbi:hypothetical protein GLYMA_19G240666v4 [Glycine max]|nr:hypothetical protein GLYMA_19G240666v4 [Glycine max]KAH1079332.1 hypothetical protein GYH30_054070 [Glycine max]